jgi:predicted NUDIX family NTP pyrophosphohydrolase
MDRSQEQYVTQAGVIPFRKREGRVEVLLITSRTAGRWIIPKGNLEPHLNARESAAQEAYEEAGVLGQLQFVSLGSYTHGVPPETQVVKVFLMEVTRELRAWPERDQRLRKWMSIREARAAISEDGLKPMLDELAELMY